MDANAKAKASVSFCIAGSRITQNYDGNYFSVLFDCIFAFNFFSREKIIFWRVLMRTPQFFLAKNKEGERQKPALPFLLLKPQTQP